MHALKPIKRPEPPVHGGRLHQAARQWGIAVEHWIDLSTGINPYSYPLPTVPSTVWQRLPDADDQLLEIAAAYYGSPALLAVAGSQAAIEQLPRLRAACRVAILSPAYAEHAYQWQRRGHDVKALSVAEIELTLTQLDVVVVIRPNNPTAECLSQARLQRWLKVLQQHNGWLIVDEAFIDALSGNAAANQAASMISNDPVNGLIVLRSVGKFFGLAGIRLGFVWAKPEVLAGLADKLGTWAVSSLARWAAEIALQDAAWQTQMRQRLADASQRLVALLARYGFDSVSTPLFCTVFCTELKQPLTKDTQAAAVYQQLAQQGILVRHLEQIPGLRLGLPADERAWQRLEKVLSELKR